MPIMKLIRSGWRPEPRVKPVTADEGSDKSDGYSPSKDIQGHIETNLVKMRELNAFSMETLADLIFLMIGFDAIRLQRGLCSEETQELDKAPGPRLYESLIPRSRIHFLIDARCYTFMVPPQL